MLPAGATPPLRLRAPALRQFSLLAENAEGETEEIAIRSWRDPQPCRLSGELVVTAGEDKYALSVVKNEDPQFWLRHAARARAQADWTAVAQIGRAHV